MRPTKFGVGQSVKRVEDIRLVSGRGNYASDAVDKAELKAVFLRSPYGHAKFHVDDIEAARAAPGVRAVYVASDFAALGGLPCLAPVPNADGSKTPLKPYPVMAADETHHVGDIVAMVVADTTLEARDAAELISVTWEDLPAVTDMEAALRPDAPLVFAGAPGNVAYDTHIGDKQETDKAFAGAAHTVRIRIVNPRAVANYMEPRSAVGEYDAQSGRFTLNAGSQGVHILQGLIAKILKIGTANLRVVTQDVGGGFGTKNMLYREYPLVLEAARRLGRSVGWLADRSEHFVGDAQGRDNVTTAEMALDSEGRFRGAAGRHPRQSWRISLDVRAIHPLARRFDGDRVLPYRRAPRARSWDLHPYGSRRRLSRRGAAGGGLCARAAGRRMRAQARHSA